MRKDQQLRRLAKEVESHEKGLKVPKPKKVRAKRNKQNGSSKRSSPRASKLNSGKKASSRESFETFPGVLDGKVNKQHCNPHSTHDGNHLAF